MDYLQMIINNEKEKNNLKTEIFILYAKDKREEAIKKLVFISDNPSLYSVFSENMYDYIDVSYSQFLSSYNSFCSNKFRNSEMKYGYIYEIEKIKASSKTKEEYIEYLLKQKYNKNARLNETLEKCKDWECDLESLKKLKEERNRIDSSINNIESKYYPYLEKLEKLKENSKYILLENFKILEDKLTKQYYKNINNKALTIKIIELLDRLSTLKKEYKTFNQEAKIASELNDIEENVAKEISEELNV